MAKKKIDLGNGFELEIIETIPDTKGNNLEGFLYFLGELLEGVSKQKLYKTKQGVINHFKNIVMPNYIEAHRSRVYSILNFHQQWRIKDFVRKIIEEKQFKYGMTIDVVEILEENHYNVPRSSDKGFNLDELHACKDVVSKVSLALLNELKFFEFGADRNTSNLVGHEEKMQYEGTYSIIYTRYPWTSIYKIIKTVKSFLSITGRNFLAGQDLSHFEELYPEIYELAMTIVDRLQDVHIGTNKVCIDTGFEKANMVWVLNMDKYDAEMMEVFKKLQPKGYGVYSKV